MSRAEKKQWAILAGLALASVLGLFAARAEAQSPASAPGLEASVRAARFI